MNPTKSSLRSTTPATAIVVIRGERFAVIPEAKYMQLIHTAEEKGPLPASHYDDEDVEDADAFVPNTIGKNLRNARQAAGLTQAELAKKLKKSQALISAAERGITEVGLKYWEAVLKACKLPKDWKPTR